jgi:hypothetical protein
MTMNHEPWRRRRRRQSRLLLLLLRQTMVVFVILLRLLLVPHIHGGNQWTTEAKSVAFALGGMFSQHRQNLHLKITNECPTMTTMN